MIKYQSKETVTTSVRGVVISSQVVDVELGIRVESVMVTADGHEAHYLVLVGDTVIDSGVTKFSYTDGNMIEVAYGAILSQLQAVSNYTSM